VLLVAIGSTPLRFGSFVHSAKTKKKRDSRHAACSVHENVLRERNDNIFSFSANNYVRPAAHKRCGQRFGGFLSLAFRSRKSRSKAFYIRRVLPITEIADLTCTADICGPCWSSSSQHRQARSEIALFPGDLCSFSKAVSTSFSTQGL